MGAKQGLVKTRILQKANAPTSRFKDFINTLARKDLLEENGGKWHTTEKGIRLIEVLKELDELCGS